MRKRITIFILLLAAFCVTFAACGFDADSSLKDVTSPYITRYGCVEARYGGEDILQQFDYIRITLLDEENMELAYKFKGESKKSRVIKYTFDKESRQLNAEGGFLGVKFKQPVVVDNGEFTVSLTVGVKQLILRFVE